MISKKNVLSDRNNAVKKKSKYSETPMTHIQMQDQKGEKTHCLCLINAHQLQKKSILSMNFLMHVATRQHLHYMGQESKKHSMHLCF